MKAILKQPQKVVNYLGIDLVVPILINYLATNPDGVVIACSCYDLNPPKINTHWTVDWQKGEDCMSIAKIDLNGIDWQDTLQEVD